MAFLTLSNGAVFEGRPIGAACDSLGELVFTTGMTGYLETLTDPSYAGQIVIQTFPLIGNTGVIPEDFEGQSFVRGYVVRELCDSPSNFRSGGPLNDLLRARGIPGLAGVDTRELTRILRENGTMNAAITKDAPADPAALAGYAVRGAVPLVSRREPAVFPAEGAARRRVALLDYGAKKSIVRSLQRRGCEVTAWPSDTPAKTILASRPDGVMLSNGPGDPSENTACIREIGALIGRLPVFGICLGHQMAALAMGGRTEKLLYGHRGANQPVRELATGRTFITSQNHGYAVLSDSLAGRGVVTHVNANDGSCEGVSYPDARCFTVQFHPEAHAGPRDTEFLFDRFIRMMEE